MSVKVQSTNNVIIDVHQQFIQMSSTIQNILIDIDINNEVETVIPLPFNSSVLKMVNQFCEEYNNKKKSEETFLREFFAVDVQVLLKLIQVANFLDIKELLVNACAAVSSSCDLMDISEIRSLFNISSDFTPEEENKIKEDNSWC